MSSGAAGDEKGRRCVEMRPPADVRNLARMIGMSRVASEDVVMPGRWIERLGKRRKMGKQRQKYKG